MVQVDIFINTNASYLEKENLDVPRKAMDEFLRNGFVENAYDANITFRCLPRAVDPSFMEIIVDLKDIAETTIAWATIIGAIIKFCKECKGYEHNLTIRKKKEDEEIEVEVNINSDDDSEKILKQIRKILK